MTVVVCDNNDWNVAGMDHIRMGSGDAECRSER